jgi:hypothetical protein
MSHGNRNSQQVSSLSPPHDPRRASCSCRTRGSLEQLPFLYGITKKGPRSYVAQFVTFLYWILFLASRLLAPFIRRPIFRVLVWIDNICLLISVFLEQVFQRASPFKSDSALAVLKPRQTKPPFVRRLSSEASGYPESSARSRLGSVLVKFSNHADEDLGEALRVIADTFQECVERYLPAADSSIKIDNSRDAGQAGKSKTISEVKHDNTNIKKNDEGEKGRIANLIDVTPLPEPDTTVLGTGASHSGLIDELVEDYITDKVVHIRDELVRHVEDEGCASSDGGDNIRMIISQCQTTPGLKTRCDEHNVLPMDRIHDGFIPALNACQLISTLG